MKRGSHSCGLQLAAGVEKTGGGCACVCSVLVSVDLKAISAGELYAGSLEAWSPGPGQGLWLVQPSPEFSLQLAAVAPRCSQPCASPW